MAKGFTIEPFTPELGEKIEKWNESVRDFHYFVFDLDTNRPLYAERFFPYRVSYAPGVNYVYFPLDT